VKLLFAFVELMLCAGGVFASQVTLHLVSFSGPWPDGWVTGYPYSLTLNGGSPFPAMCDDYNHDGIPDHNGIPGDTWQANLTNLGTGDVTNLRFASFGLRAYQQVGWLLLQSKVEPPSHWAAINYAAWYIFAPSQNVLLYSNANYWYGRAAAALQNGFPGVDFSRVEIGTPIDIDAPSTGPQEFIWITPEPGSLILVSTSALGAFALLRRNLQH